MSMERLRSLSRPLSALVRDQVLGYAESVNAALPEIFEEVRLSFDEQVADEVVLIAGIRKLDAICSSAALLLDRAMAGLAADQIMTIRIGASEYAEDSRDYTELTELSNLMRATLRDLEMEPFITMRYDRMVRELYHGRRQG